METELKSTEKALEYKELGNKEFKIQNYIKAIEFYSKAISFDDNFAPIFANRAACYLQLKKYQQCINDCEKCIKINPEFTKAYLRKARSQMMLGNLSVFFSMIKLIYQQSFFAFSKAKELDPKDKQIESEYIKAKEVERNLNIMKDEYDKQNYNDAITFLNQILIQVPDWRIMQCIQIECLARIGALDKASKIINQIQYEMQSNPDFLYARGIYALYNNQLDQARQCFLEGCKLDPDHSKSRLTYQKIKKIEKLKDEGNQCLQNQRYDEAIQNYQEALEVDSSNKILNAILYANKATALMKLKKFKEALEECNKSIEANEKYWKSYFKRAEIKMELQEYEEAIYDYNKVKELDPTQNISGRLHQAKESAKRAKQKDYYKILGVERTATEEEIKRAYKKLAIKWHPDKHQGEDKEQAQKMFRDIAEAYSILTDKKKRSMVDQGIDPNDQTGGFGAGDIDPTQIFSMFFGGGMGGMGGMGGRSSGFSFGGDDFFSSGRSGGPQFKFSFR